MTPTLKNSDILYTVSYEDNIIRCGDVVVFNTNDSNDAVVHRVVSIDPLGIKTKGDNNHNIDDWFIVQENVLGRVAYAQTGIRQRIIYRGLAGKLFVVGIKSLRIIDHAVSFLLHFPYRWLARSGIFRRMIPRRLKIKVLSFNKPSESDLQLLMGRRVIGQFIQGKDQWQIQRPFRLFIDESTLPHSIPEDKIK